MGRQPEWQASGLRALVSGLTGPGAPWKAKSVWLAAGVAILGTGFWRSDAPGPQPAPSAQEQAVDAAGPSQSADQGTSPASSAAVNLGVSYIGGFFLGWCYRRFVKVSVMLTCGILAVLMAIKSLGWFETDVASLQDHVREGSSWLGNHAADLNRYLTGLLPSAGAAGFGLFRGFRRKLRAGGPEVPASGFSGAAG